MAIVIPRQKIELKDLVKSFDGLTRNELAYLGGWFDTDASFESYPDSKSKTVVVSLNLVDRGPVEYLSKIFKSSLRTGKTNPEMYKNKVGKIYYRTKVSGQTAVEFTKRVGHFVFNRTRERDALLATRNEFYSFKYLEMSDEEFICWLTSCFEGDGSVHVNHVKKEYMVSITNNNRAMLSYIVKRCKNLGLFWSGPYIAQKEEKNVKWSHGTDHTIDRETGYVISTSSVKAYEFCQIIYHKMTCERKKVKVREICLTFNLENAYEIWKTKSNSKNFKFPKVLPTHRIFTKKYAQRKSKTKGS